MTQTFIHGGFRPLIVLPEFGCCKFPLTLITGYSNIKRCPKGLYFRYTPPYLHCDVQGACSGPIFLQLSLSKVAGHFEIFLRSWFCIMFDWISGPCGLTNGLFLSPEGETKSLWCLFFSLMSHNLNTMMWSQGTLILFRSVPVLIYAHTYLAGRAQDGIGWSCPLASFFLMCPQVVPPAFDPLLVRGPNS